MICPKLFPHSSSATPLSPGTKHLSHRIAISFQKESCIHCGRLWTDHEGVASLVLTGGFVPENELTGP